MGAITTCLLYSQCLLQELFVRTLIYFYIIYPEIQSLYSQGNREKADKSSKLLKKNAIQDAQSYALSIIVVTFLHLTNFQNDINTIDNMYVANNESYDG